MLLILLLFFYPSTKTLNFTPTWQYNYWKRWYNIDECSDKHVHIPAKTLNSIILFLFRRYDKTKLMFLCPHCPLTSLFTDIFLQLFLRKLYIKFVNVFLEHKIVLALRLMNAILLVNWKDVPAVPNLHRQTPGNPHKRAWDWRAVCKHIQNPFKIPMVHSIVEQVLASGSD